MYARIMNHGPEYEASLVDTTSTDESLRILRAAEATDTPVLAVQGTLLRVLGRCGLTLATELRRRTSKLPLERTVEGRF